MVGESRDVFIKRVLGKKHIICIVCENPGVGGGGRRPCTSIL